MSTESIVEVAVPVPVEDTFFYTLPAGALAEPGMRVLVPYGGRRVVGLVISLPARAALGSGVGARKLRTVHQVLDAEPVLPMPLIEVVLRAAHDALCPPGTALAAAIPPGTAPRPGQRVRLLEPGRRALERGEAGGTLGKVLWSLGRQPLAESVLRSRFPAAAGALARLTQLGWIAREVAMDPPRVKKRTERVYRVAPDRDPVEVRAELARAPRRLEIYDALLEQPAPLRSSAALRALLEAGVVEWDDREVLRGDIPPPLTDPEDIPELTGAQREATREIAGAIAARREQTFLLYGITGSGKTEVYMRAAAHALEQGRGVIVLVPEISLTHQVVDRFRARFGDQVGVLHSGLSAGERFDQWRRLRESAVPIAIGARSAVFAPLPDPGLIVIDEEHDPAYKSEEGFRYHAREVAMLRARAAGCPVVLGSATPDVETAWRSAHGEIQRLTLPERVANRPLPEVEIVDMGAEQRRRGKRTLLSRSLRVALAETLAAGHQAILFLNRRGFASMVYCYACGHALRCQHCDISLVYHAKDGPRRRDDPLEGELRCHYCNYTEPPRATCPSCGSEEGSLLGFGTEQLEEEVAAMYPSARVARLDRDTSARKGAQRSILAAFHRGDVDVLVGTQMVAKGHDIAGVTLVGVVAADLGLHFPDFRAGERTFQLLTQVAGRAGRGDDPGRVVIQTFLPDHYAIALARTHDFPSFYRQELARRKPHRYPPYRSLVHLALSGRKEPAVEEAAQTLARLARLVPVADAPSEELEILGPAPAPLTRIRDEFRWQLMLLGDREVVRIVAAELAKQARARFSGVTLRLDTHPLQML